jgi:TetR/AcrR family transcriptional regulator, transcriptional repressor for nem operon
MAVGRPLEFDPEMALTTAMEVFWRKGYESSSLQDLLTATGLSKSSFYQAFRSKRALFQLSIRHYRKSLIDGLGAKLTQAGSGMAFIKALFHGVAQETSGPNARRGCLLMNTASEFAQTDPEIAELISASIDSLTDVFELAIKQAQQLGELPSGKDARTLAIYLVSSMSGLKNMTKAGADRETIRRISEVTLSALA